ncbi:MAG TPA: acyl-CoA dehydrogenase family protein [Polyangia bacterium]|nr:acyl-CoA dehydrogenase family protein [Polyangia bacterium]
MSEIIEAGRANAAVDALARTLGATAVERDRRGGTAKSERDLIRRSGLLGLAIPREFGGEGASWSETLSAVRRLARADGSLAHLFGFHHLLVATVRLYGAETQWSRAYRETASGALFWGNALNPLDRRSRIVPAGEGGYTISGRKTFCSGASDADRLIVSALDADERLVVAAIPASRAGIVVHDDWDAFGQRQTDSGSVSFEAVAVGAQEILRSPGPLGSVFASLRSCLAQLTLVNVFLGIGEGALEAARAYTRDSARPWITAGVERAGDDPYVLRHYGELWVGLEGARLLAEAAARAFDRAWGRGDELTQEARAGCAVAIATAKVAATRAGLDVATRLFDVAGARATAAGAGLDRFWRNLRTHTLHDPADHKLRELGQWALDGTAPTPSFYS